MNEQTNSTDQTTTAGTERADAIAEAEKVVADLRIRADDLVARKQELVERRKALSFAAVAQNDRAALKQLATLSADMLRLGEELTACIDAGEEADRRLEEVQAAQAVRADRANARQIRAVLVEFVDAGESLSEALLAIGEEGKALREAARKLRALGCTYPSDQQIAVLGLQALQTALMATPWSKEFAHLPPAQRRNFAALVREWAARIMSQIEPRLEGEGEQQQRTAEDVNA